MFVPSHDKSLVETSIKYQGINQSHAPAIIIAHPYGPLGGNMNNNVVKALQHHFVSLGYITVCFNFRGSGLSQGRTSWTGMPERQDYTAVMNFILDAQDEEYKNLNLPCISSLIICGYSFGAMIAHTIECTRVPCSYLLVSVCLGVTWMLATVKSGFFKTHITDQFKTLCIFGDQDQFTGAGTYESWCDNHKNIKCVKVLGTDHFWFGSEQTLIKKVNDWLLTL